jgi:hypothetical protein
MNILAFFLFDRKRKRGFSEAPCHPAQFANMIDCPSVPSWQVLRGRSMTTSKILGFILSKNKERRKNKMIIKVDLSEARRCIEQKTTFAWGRRLTDLRADDELACPFVDCRIVAWPLASRIYTCTEYLAHTRTVGTWPTGCDQHVACCM